MDNNKFEGKYSMSSTYSNKTNNTNESNVLIKEINGNDNIHSNHENNKFDSQLNKSFHHCNQSKHIADYFEESLNILNAIHFYLDKSQKNNSISMSEDILKLKSCNNNDVYDSNQHNHNVKHLLSLHEKEIIMKDIEKRSVERKNKYNTLFSNINESILSLSDNKNLKEAVCLSSGIRILRQDKWEALCSFIISQNNNIPRIKKLVSALCYACDEKNSPPPEIMAGHIADAHINIKPHHHCARFPH